MKKFLCRTLLGASLLSLPSISLAGTIQETWGTIKTKATQIYGNARENAIQQTSFDPEPLLQKSNQLIKKIQERKQKETNRAYNASSIKEAQYYSEKLKTRQSGEVCSRHHIKGQLYKGFMENCQVDEIRRFCTEPLANLGENRKKIIEQRQAALDTGVDYTRDELINLHQDLFGFLKDKVIPARIDCYRALKSSLAQNSCHQVYEIVFVPTIENAIAESCEPEMVQNEVMEFAQIMQAEEGLSPKVLIENSIASYASVRMLEIEILNSIKSLEPTIDSLEATVPNRAPTSVDESPTPRIRPGNLQPPTSMTESTTMVGRKG